MQDEVKELDREVEERHAAELAAAEARNGQRQPTPAEATVASLSSGLYSTKLTADQPSDRKEPTRAQKRRELRALEEVRCLPGPIASRRDGCQQRSHEPWLIPLEMLDTASSLGFHAAILLACSKQHL